MFHISAIESRPFDYAAAITFADITPGIEDQEVFIPPEQCEPGPVSRKLLHEI